jgi:hypothetical protein
MTDQFDMFEGEGSFLEKMRHNWKKAIEGNGAVCPCCDRFGKVNMFRFTQTWALTLKWIADHEGENGWVNIQTKGPRIVLRGKNYSMVANWGLIESQSNRSGVWRLTQQGKDFIAGNIYIPVKLFTYNNKPWGFSSEQTSFRGCFGKHFDFDEMMSAQFKWANLQERKK